MAEELQGLLDRIQKEGVRKAESEAERIVADARARAEQVLSEARGKAEDILKQAQSDAASFDERARKSLEQAARDTVLAVGDAVSDAFRTLVKRKVEASLSGDTLAAIVRTAVEAYFQNGGTGRLDVLLSPEDQEKLSGMLLEQFAEELREGVEIKGDRGIVSGFRVAIGDGKMQHDFSADAVTDAICTLVRPQLARIVRKALKA